MKIIRFWGLRRSGHHAVINWVLHCASLDYKTEFYNNVCKLNERKPPLAKDTDVFVYNIEDKDLETKIQKCFRHHRMTDKFDAEYIVIRDPFNNLASRITVKRKIHKNFKYEKSNKIWKRLYKNHLEACMDKGDKVINYNQWFFDKEYRMSIISGMNFQYIDNCLDEVPSYGHGSSFDGMEYDGNARQMKVMDRWLEFLNDDIYLSVFDDKEFLDRISGFYPKETERFLQVTGL